MGVARERNRLGLLLRTGTWWASFEANSKSGNCLQIEPCPKRQSRQGQFHDNQGEGFDEVVLRARGQTIALFGMVP
ncbi:hypothetical protein [Lapidilactobacillus achengensis]|uniref:hypothetical protein n=1 Tax=Lapidilactobacillus achengensis TaxID=2486000 RepID=UPI000F7BA440|nr:hypothetical protein [Lapidilactobacillus achengensis]